MPPTPVSEGRGPHLGAQQAPQDRVGGANALLSSLAPPDGSSRLPLLISPVSLLCPQDPHSLDGALEAGYWLGSSAGSPGLVGQAIALRSSPTPPGRPLPPASPVLPDLRGANPGWPPLLLPPLSPCVLPVHFRFPPVSLGVRVCHPWPAGTLVLGRR